MRMSSCQKSKRKMKEGDAEEGVRKPTHRHGLSGWQNPRLRVLRPRLLSSDSPSSLYRGLVEIQFTPHTVHTFKVYDSVVFSVFTDLTTTILEHVHDPKRTPNPLAPPPRPHPPPMPSLPFGGNKVARFPGQFPVETLTAVAMYWESWEKLI